jgi:hypothetical protein
MEKEFNDFFHLIKIIFVFIFVTTLTILIALKITTVRIFSNFEFHTQKYRFLKFISIIDTLSLATTFLLPFIENQNLLDDWFMNGYLLASYELYVNSFLNKGLLTLSSVINLYMSWNQYKEFKDYNTAGQWFKLTIFVSHLFSLLLHLPNLFIYKISEKANSAINFTIEISQVDYFKYYSPFQHVISFSILVAILMINLTLLLKIRKHNKSKFQSIIFTANTRAYSSVLEKESRYCQIQHKIILKSLNSSATASSTVSLRRNSKLVDTRIQGRLLWVAFAILADEFIRASYELSKLFVKRNTTTSSIILVFYLVIMLLTQLLPIITLYKINNSFAERFRQIIRKCALLNFI